MARDDTRRAAELLLNLANLIDEHTDELVELESAQWSASCCRRARRDAGAADNIRFFAGAARILEGRSTGEYMGGYTS